MRTYKGYVSTVLPEPTSSYHHKVGMSGEGVTSTVDQELTNKLYGCKVIWADFLASYPQLPI